MTGFEIDPAIFPKVAATLDEQRTALAGHTEVVNSYASGKGNPWGDDKQGSAFGSIYADVLNHVSEVMSNHADLLTYASSELRSWADDVVLTDDGVAGRLNSLGSDAMSIELPGFLTEALSYIGMNWPQADEDKLFDASGAWSTFAGQLREVESSTSTAAADIWGNNHGAAVEAFQAWWDANPKQHLTDDASGSEAIGTILTIFGTATIALKGIYLVQLGILAATLIQAVATAFVTFGASLAEIPIVSALVRKAIETAIENMIFEILF